LQSAYFWDVLVEVVLLSVLPLPFFFFLLLCVFVVVVEEEVDVFCAFLAAGAAIRNGTARAVNMVLVTNFFMVVFSPLVCGGFVFEAPIGAEAVLVALFFRPVLISRFISPLTTILSLITGFAAITSNRILESRI
jgi:hypothetical protein